MVETDVVIIGAGIVGAAIAERLSRSGHRVVVVERHPRPLQETSSRSSQVVHAGLYYPAGSLKARLCVAGNASTLEWCRAHQVPHAQIGKLIVATTVAEVPELERRLAVGRGNGVELSLVDAGFVRRLEPEVHAVAALWSPSSGIVDVHALGDSLLGLARDRGVTFAFRHAVVGLERRAGGWSVELEDPVRARARLDARVIVNAAGLFADDVAALAGLDVDALGYRQRFVKGSWFRLKAQGRLRHLVYPLPPPGLAGLGVHVTVGLDGALTLGPDVEPLEGRRLDYSVSEARGPDFAAAARRYLPWVTADRLEPDQAGIRPKLSAGDFVVEEESARGCAGLINLLGIESPGLTCALELAKLVEALAGRQC